MVESSFGSGSELTKDSTTPELHRDDVDITVVNRRLYFVNEIVEWKLTKYIWTGCTSVELRDDIMSHASDLIRQIIRKQGLHTIYPGQDESSFGDLLNTAWCQVERTLYKYRSRPFCRSCYSPERPSESILYTPGNNEYGIKTFKEVIDMHKGRCPKCGSKLSAEPIVEPEQGRFGGSNTILFRGISKVFNMWCISPDSLLLSSDGIDTIQNIVNDEIRHVYGLNGFTNVNGYLEKQEQDCINLKTTYSYSIIASPEHRFWVNSDGVIGWKEVQDIDDGDLVAIQYDQQVFFNEDCININLNRRGHWSPPSKMTEELAYLIGLFIAEGSYSYGKLVIYNVEQEIVDKLINNKLGLNFVHEPQFDRISLCNVRFIEFLSKLGFGEKTSAGNKFIPKFMLKCSKDVLSAMLRGMFDGDGHSRSSDGTVGYTSTSKHLISQLRVLLLNFGILTKLSEDRRDLRTFNRRTYTSKLKGSQQIQMSNYYSQRFYNDIGFELTRKQINHNKLILNDLEMHDTQLRMFGLNSKFRSLYKKHGCGNLGYDAIRKIIKADYCTLGTAVSKISSWIEHEHDEDFQFIMARINERQEIVNKLVWLPVVEKSHTRSRLCEISVESQDHSYIANGFVSHNSQVSRTVILAYIKKEGRDRKNSNSYVAHLGNKYKPTSGVLDRLCMELREIHKYDSNNLQLIDALQNVANNDDRPYDGLIGKLVSESGQSRTQITNFLGMIKLFSMELSDSLINRAGVEPKINKEKQSSDSDDE